MSTTKMYQTENGKMVEVSVEIDKAIEIYKEDPSAVYPQGFFRKMVKLRGWQSEAGRKIAEKWGVQSVVDFGCASGYYI